MVTVTRKQNVQDIEKQEGKEGTTELNKTN